ncbi:MAG: hypothetical protein ACRD5M_16450 [Candidatus Acidiferrales bacterium]
MAVLDVWIAKPGNACQMDDGPWFVTIFDAHGNVFTRAGSNYSGQPAPQGHWSGAVPPGVYVVQAVSKARDLSTDHAIVSVNCNDTACVRLYVSPKGGPSGGCDIKIKQVIGIASNPTAAVATAIRVTGTAQNCQEVLVTIICGSGRGQKTATVQGDGSWEVDVSIHGGCRCGGSCQVTAQCVQNERCRDEYSTPSLKCSE